MESSCLVPTAPALSLDVFKQVVAFTYKQTLVMFPHEKHDKSVSSTSKQNSDMFTIFKGALTCHRSFLYPRADPRPQGSPHTGGTFLLIRERAFIKMSVNSSTCAILL